MTQAQALFLFKSGRKARLDEGGPREFFYGFTEMGRLDVAAQLLEEEDLPVQPLPILIERLATAGLDRLAALNAGTLARLCSGVARRRINQAGVIVATTNAHGLALGALKRAGWIKPTVLFLPMGVAPLQDCRLRAAIRDKWLSALRLAPISKAESGWLQARGFDAPYLPFGVDTAFWHPRPASGAGGDVLAIGNDPHRDWQCLARAWEPGLPRLHVVTRRPFPPSAGEVAVTAGDWNSRPLSDAAVRDLYRAARFVVVPIRDTLQPSGQSACLQAMACGKAVILSDFTGLWDDELIRDGETCLLTPHGDAQALNRAARRLTEDSALAERLGRAARDLVERRFTVERMGTALAQRLASILSSGMNAPP